jgi:hypothetical protein
MEIPSKINAVKPNLDFAILNSIPPEYFDEIALDCKIVFLSRFGLYYITNFYFASK